VDKLNHSGMLLWFTGLSGAGKTTIALGVTEKLKAQNYKVELLDGDVVRTHLSKGLSFTKEDRDTNIRRIAFVANLLSRNGIITIAAAISPYRELRDEIRRTTTNFVEVYVNATLEVCEARDVKGLYARARTGEIPNFTGISDPYEAPVTPEIICYTEVETIEQSIDKVLSYILRNSR